MTDKAKSLLGEIDCGKPSRRQALKVLGAAGAAMAIAPASSFAQGVCHGPIAGVSECDTTPAKLPFKPTGWKTIRLDFLTCQAADHAKEAAFHAALMNWKIRSDDGKKAVLDINDWGGMIIRKSATADTKPIYDGFSWGIDNWDAKKVEAALRERGLSPVADNSMGFESFHVKDPDGFDLWISNGKDGARKQPAMGKTSAPAPFEPTNWKTTWIDHISLEVPDYKKTAAFYHALLGWELGWDEGSQNQLEIGDLGDITIRRKKAPAGTVATGASISHISWGITPFDPDLVKEGLEKRGLEAKMDTGNHGDIHVAMYKSYHTITPHGFNLQISAANKVTRSLSGLT